MFFFFQAEDGIRDYKVTGVQTCALPIYLAARMLVQRRYTWRGALALGVVLGCGEMVRQFSLWTLAVVVLAFGAALWARTAERRAVAASLAITLVACAAIALPWYVYRAIHY